MLIIYSESLNGIPSNEFITYFLIILTRKGKDFQLLDSAVRDDIVFLLLSTYNGSNLTNRIPPTFTDQSLTPFPTFS